MFVQPIARSGRSVATAAKRRLLAQVLGNNTGVYGKLKSFVSVRVPANGFIFQMILHPALKAKRLPKTFPCVYASI